MMLSLSIGISSSAAEDAVQTGAAKTFADRKENAVRLTVTRKIRDRDRTSEVQALVIDEQGIIVTSLDGIESVGSGLQEMLQRRGGGNADKGELTRVAMIRSDGSETEGEVVLTDPDLDLAFIKVTLPEDEDAAKLASAPAVAARPLLLDEAVAISRMDAGFQYEATAAMVQIAAVLEIPRVLYVPAGGTGDKGVGVFNLKGECLGITAQIHNKLLIVPMETILKLAGTISQ
ncbi:MAG: trypsin-like peptidase domain-containing protein [Planctomycetales bacterium]|nr:trypsin-like peptidase domain-containing protein [Planctomycetales bacterium]